MCIRDRPYKAKGIFCFNEQIKLKKGKKL
jgi:hypothetical protein